MTLPIPVASSIQRRLQHIDVSRLGIVEGVDENARSFQRHHAALQVGFIIIESRILYRGRQISYPRGRNTRNNGDKLVVVVCSTRQSSLLYTPRHVQECAEQARRWRWEPNPSRNLELVRYHLFYNQCSPSSHCSSSFLLQLSLTTDSEEFFFSIFLIGILIS